MSETVPKTTHAKVPCGAKESTTPRPYGQSSAGRDTKKRAPGPGRPHPMSLENIRACRSSPRRSRRSSPPISPSQKPGVDAVAGSREEDEVNAPPVLSRASISELVDRRGHLYRHGGVSSQSKACVGGETGRRARSGARNRGGISPQRSTGLPEFAPAPLSVLVDGRCRVSEEDSGQRALGEFWDSCISRSRTE